MTLPGPPRHSHLALPGREPWFAASLLTPAALRRKLLFTKRTYVRNTNM
jgi:hypothetical protein